MKAAFVLGLMGSLLLLAGEANAGTTIIKNTLDYNAYGDFDEPGSCRRTRWRIIRPTTGACWKDWGWTHKLRKLHPLRRLGHPLRLPDDQTAWMSTPMTPRVPNRHRLRQLDPSSAPGGYGRTPMEVHSIRPAARGPRRPLGRRRGLHLRRHRQ